MSDHKDYDSAFSSGYLLGQIEYMKRVTKYLKDHDYKIIEVKKMLSDIGQWSYDKK